MFSDSLKLQLYQHRGQLNLLKIEACLEPPHLNIAVWCIEGFYYDVIARMLQLLFRKGNTQPDENCMSAITIKMEWDSIK